MRNLNNNHPNCLTCLVSFHAQLLNNAISPTVVYNYVREHLLKDKEEFAANKATMPYDEIIRVQGQIYQMHTLLSLLERVKAHR
jgi:hypothetical protein